MTKEQILASALADSNELRRLWAEWIHMLMAEDDVPDEAA